jgi:hypothetical protein
MRTLSVKLVLTSAIATVLCAMPVSIGSSGSEDHPSSNIVSNWLKIETAQAVIGRPATPGSVAGVARRSTRRAVRRGY